MKTEKTSVLTGFCDAEFKCGWDETTDGYVIQLDGENYGCYYDPDDGYRSYGEFSPTTLPCTNTFPPQEVTVVEYSSNGGYNWYEDPKFKRIEIRNKNTNEVILVVGTIWYDSYYPMGICEWHPENLPINKDR